VKTDTCSTPSAKALAFTVTVNELPDAPTLSGENPRVCVGKEINETFLLSLVIYADTVLFTDASGALLTIPFTFESDTTVYVAELNQETGCISDTIAVAIHLNCPNVEVRGTVFPFVYWCDENEVPDVSLNELFVVNVHLRNIPDTHVNEEFYEELNTGTPVYSTTAIYYNGTIFAEGTPKGFPDPDPDHIGEFLPCNFIGSFNNYGKPINWEILGQPSIPDVPDLLEENEKALIGLGMTVGLYVFEEVAPGTYILEIQRDGFVKRWAKVIIEDDAKHIQYLGHREIVPGDVSNNLIVDLADFLAVENALNSDDYDPMYDFYGFGFLTPAHLELLTELYAQEFQFWFYLETEDMLKELGIDY
jgi:hypothetical protein